MVSMFVDRELLLAVEDITGRAGGARGNQMIILGDLTHSPD